MTQRSDLSYVHVFRTGKPGLPLLILLHGTGGDETDLIPIAERLLPGAALLSPRGNVLENGMNRFFARKAHGVFDMEDLEKRTRELTLFIRSAQAAYGIEETPAIAVGYSNGANIAINMMLHDPTLFAGAILLRPMFPTRPETHTALPGIPVLIASGRRDAMVIPEQPRTLASVLTDCGSEVTLHWEEAGHPLTDGDLHAAETWLHSHFSASRGSSGKFLTDFDKT